MEKSPTSSVWRILRDSTHTGKGNQGFQYVDPEVSNHDCTSTGVLAKEEMDLHWTLMRSGKDECKRGVVPVRQSTNNLQNIKTH